MIMIIARAQGYLLVLMPSICMGIETIPSENRTK